MTLPTLVATVGASNANSFGTRAEADAYFETVLHTDAPWPSSVAASVVIGSGTNGLITITLDAVGTEGNDYTVVIVNGSGNNVPLSAVLASMILTITLGTDGAGAVDATKNTAILVTAILNAISGISATYTGSGSGVLVAATSKSFSGGSYIEETKLPALIMAAQQINALFGWTGYPATTTQKLTWPRSSMYDRNDNAIPIDVIPDELKQAQFELARLLIDSDRTIENDISINGLTHLRAGPVTMKFREFGEIGASVISSAVYNLIPESWYFYISGVSSGTRDLLRA